MITTCCGVSRTNCTMPWVERNCIMSAAVLPCAIWRMQRWCSRIQVNHDRGVGIEFALLLDMVRTNPVVHMTGAHHQPEPVNGLLLLFQQFRCIETKIHVGQKEQRLGRPGVF